MLPQHVCDTDTARAARAARDLLLYILHRAPLRISGLYCLQRLRGGIVRGGIGWYGSSVERHSPFPRHKHRTQVSLRALGSVAFRPRLRPSELGGVVEEDIALLVEAAEVAHDHPPIRQLHAQRLIQKGAALAYRGILGASR